MTEETVGASSKIIAVIGLFDTAQGLLEGIPKVRERDLGDLQAYTPYPVHGLTRALGQKRSPLGTMVFLMGLLGVFVALALQWWTSVADYPIVTGGKALFSWQAFVPILFEVMVLLATFTAGLGMLFLLNRLPFFGNPLLGTAAMKAITRDRFALAVHARGSTLDEAAARGALEAAGARDVEVVPEPPGTPLTSVYLLRSAVAIALACAAAGLLTYFGIKWFPLLPPMNAMDRQKHAVPGRESSFFHDGRVMRPPVSGTVARGQVPLPSMAPEEAAALLANPLPATAEVFARGKARYEIHCRVCHGAVGDGRAELPATYGAKPADLHSATVRGYADGRIYHVIATGKNTMPAYAADISPEDRWAIVRYVRALQRSQSAQDGDLP